jgi:serine-type D-Ala-D-Ala carboxypeptidase/endopeptidase (penicillin-binding protein 4)
LLGIGTPARGRCVAKTGTLDNVTNLAGYCRARGGIDLTFALMIDGPANYIAIPILSRVVAAIARY